MNPRSRWRDWAKDPTPRPPSPHPNPHVEALRLAADHHANKAAVYRRRGYLTAAALNEGQAIGLRHAIDIITTREVPTP